MNVIKTVMNAFSGRFELLNIKGQAVMYSKQILIKLLKITEIYCINSNYCLSTASVIPTVID